MYQTGLSLPLYIAATSSHPLSESDPQFSSPMRSVVFPDDEASDQQKHSSPPEPDIDPALLQAVLSDPVLLQAVDPLVLQAVLVSAAAANLAKPNLPSEPGTTQYSQHSFLDNSREYTFDRAKEVASKKAMRCQSLAHTNPCFD